MNAESDLQSAPESEGPGAQLGRVRAARELSISDVAERIKYSPRQIAALEADEYDKLPGATFVRGMIRSYAKLLQTDPEPVLKQFEDRHLPEQISLALRSERIPFPDGSGRATRLYLGLAGLAVVAAAAIMFEWQFGLGAVVPSTLVPSTVQPAPPTPAPVAVQPMSAPVAPVEQPVEQLTSVILPEPNAPVQLSAHSAAPSDAKRILLEFQRDSWVEIKDGGGNTLLSRLNPGGSTAAVEGRPPFSVVIGNAANVRLTYDDATVDLKPYMRIEVARLTLE